MTRFLTVVFLLLALTLSAADPERVTLTITVTNPPVTGNSLTVNSSTRIATNQTASLFFATNSTVNNSATNLFLHIAANPFGSPRMILQWANTNQIRLIGQIGQVITATTNGLWATLTLSTQSGPTTLNAVYPFANIVGDTNRTNQASQFVSGMSAYATQSFATSAVALANHMTLGVAPGGIIQTAQTAKVFWKLEGTNIGTIYAGKYVAPTNINPITSNLVNYGNAIRSEGLGGVSLQVGSNALAQGLRGVAIGNSAYSTNNDAVAVGTDATAEGVSMLAVGNGAKATNGSTSTAIGNGAVATINSSTAVGNAASAATYAGTAVGSSAIAAGTNSTALGAEANTSELHENSVAIGATATTTTNNQVRLGTASHVVSIPGRLETGSLTNTTLRGINTLNGGLIVTARINGNAANGNNTGLLLGTNYHVTIMGPSAAYTNGGFVAEPDGSRHTVQLTNPVATCLIVNDALDGTAANRILTGTGADLLLTNNPAFMEIRYDGGAAKWRVMWHSR